MAGLLELHGWATGASGPGVCWDKCQQGSVYSEVTVKDHDVNC